MKNKWLWIVWYAIALFALRQMIEQLFKDADELREIAWAKGYNSGLSRWNDTIEESHWERSLLETLKATKSPSSASQYSDQSPTLSSTQTLGGMPSNNPSLGDL